MLIAAAPAQVEILSEGDSINELMLLVGGMVEVLKPGMDDTAEELSISMDGHSSIRGGYARHDALSFCRVYISTSVVRDISIALSAHLSQP